MTIEIRVGEGKGDAWLTTGCVLSESSVTTKDEKKATPRCCWDPSYGECDCIRYLALAFSWCRL